MAQSICLPPDPLVDSYHWICRFESGPAIPLYWNAEWHKNDAPGWGSYGQPDREHKWKYVALCPTPNDNKGKGAVTVQKFQMGDRVKPKDELPFVIVNITMWAGKIQYSSHQQTWYWADDLTLVPDRPGYVASERRVVARRSRLTFTNLDLYSCETDAELAARHAIERAAYNAQGG